MKLDEILLDTHILIWLMSGNQSLGSEARSCIEAVSQQSGKIHVSAISIWEIGMLEAKGRIHLKEPVAQWIEKVLKAPGIYLTPLSSEILIESCYLPGTIHADPADRMIIATARVLNISLITKDAKILEYASQGYVSTISV
jgi:PIN domain nuclease of toxin-antitoxin system